MVSFCLHLGFPSVLSFSGLPAKFLYTFLLPEVITFGLLPSVTFLWFLANVSEPYIRPIFSVQFSPDPEDGTKRWSRTKGNRCRVTTQTL